MCKGLGQVGGRKPLHVAAALSRTERQQQWLEKRHSRCALLHQSTSAPPPSERVCALASFLTLSSCVCCLWRTHALARLLSWVLMCGKLYGCASGVPLCFPVFAFGLSGVGAYTLPYQ